jgi:ATPase subunit of ABC transporter with duplicated ATPase domains
MISISNLEKSYGDRTLFSGATFQLNAGSRYGLVGANGSGKTTFLDIVSGQLEASEGTVSIPKRLRLGVLRQDQFLYEDEEILAVAMMGNPELWEAMVEKEELLAKAEQYFDADRFSELEETVQRHDGYTAEARATKILEGLGLPGHVHRDPLSTLSGGFKLRVLLAQVLAGTPDVLLLDEPTNHLDILSIRWLEMFLRDFSGPVVVISHDHRFLDNVTTHILDVDYESVLLYHGNYTTFLQAKQAERERREKGIAAREREIAHHQKFVDRFRAKASKARQAQSKVRMIEKKAEGLIKLAPSSRRYPTFRFEQVRDSGRDVLKIKGVKKAFGDNHVLHGVDLLVQRGERLAIMGPNGIGKSTLLKIVMGELDADEGEVEWGYETHPGYFPQDHRDRFDPPHNTAEGWVWDACSDKDIGYVRARMALMLFSGDDSKKRLSALSGGEASRLVFTRLAMARPNVLVLDEPTNHLDLESIEALIEGLRAFPGTLILVSHDRWFVSRLATRIVEIKPEEILDYHGTYEEYVHFCGDDHLDADRVILKAKTEKRKKKEGGKKREEGKKGRKKKKERNNDLVLERGNGRGATLAVGVSKARKKQLLKRQDALTTSIQEAEARVTQIDEVFCEPAYFERTSADEVKILEAERTSLQGEVADLTSEWESVEEEIG